jgi:DNA-binding transcriptional ArsR family regulator
MTHQSTPGAPDRCALLGIHRETVAHARTRLAPDQAYRAVADLFGALADPTRAKMLHALVRQELCTCDLAAVVGVSESGVSQHLRVLRALHVVQSRRVGKFVYHSLDDAHVAMLLQTGLTHRGHSDALQVGTGSLQERGA